MERLCSSETLVTIDRSAWCNISENRSLTKYGGIWSSYISYNCCPCNLNLHEEVDRNFIVHLLRGSHAYHYLLVHNSEQVCMKYVVCTYVNKVWLILAW